MDSPVEKHQYLYQVFANMALRKNMHGYLPPVFIIALLMTISLFSGCVFPSAPVNQTPEIPPVNATPTIDIGLVPVERTPDQAYISFAEAKENLVQSELLSLDIFPKPTRILFIQGGNLDKSGNALHWVFGVHKGDINELRVYDRSGWSIIPWNGAISGEDIDLDRVVSPRDLFNQSTIQNLESTSSAIPVQRDIELKNGIYTIAITSGSTSQVLMFNATTGAAIE